MEKFTLITGGAGFIGRNLGQKLVEGGGRVIALDNLHPQVHPNGCPQEALHPDIKLIIGDVRDGLVWDRLLNEFNVGTLIHLAAETGTAQSLSESTRHGSVNVVGTTEMLDAFTRRSVKPEHVLLASSRAVYGEGAWIDENGERFYPEARSHEQLASENWDIKNRGIASKPLPHHARTVFPNPSSVYGATKLAQENIISAWCSAMSVSLSILRLQNVYGPGQSPYNSYTGIINVFHRLAYSGHSIDVYEDGLIGRDFVYIDDVIRALLSATKCLPYRRRVLDVGTGWATTILQVANLIAELHGAPKPKISGRYRDGDIRWAVADCSDLRSDLGISCDVAFESFGAQAVGDWLVSKGFMG